MMYGKADEFKEIQAQYKFTSNLFQINFDDVQKIKNNFKNKKKIVRDFSINIDKILLCEFCHNEYKYDTYNNVCKICNNTLKVSKKGRVEVEAEKKNNDNKLVLNVNRFKRGNQFELFKYEKEEIKFDSIINEEDNISICTFNSLTTGKTKIRKKVQFKDNFGQNLVEYWKTPENKISDYRREIKPENNQEIILNNRYENTLEPRCKCLIM
jgi:hypothetical protein